MATVLNQNQDDDQNNQNQGVISSGESSQFGGAPAAQGSAPSGRQPSSSGRFTNLSKYIQANNPQDLTNKVSGKVGEITGKAEGDLQKSKGQFQSDAAATGEAVKQAQQGIQQGIQNISGSGDYNVSNDQFNQGLGQIQAAKDLKYAGPQGLSNEQNLQGQAQQLGSLGDATKTGGGRFALLQKFFNRPTYQSGQVNLDNLLLGSNNKALGDVRRTARSFGTELGQAQGQARTQIAGLQNDVSNTNQGALTEAGNLAQGSLGDLGTELQNYYQSEQARKTAGTGLDPSSYQFGVNEAFGTAPTPTGKGQLPALGATQSKNLDFSSSLSPTQLVQAGLANYTNDPILQQYEQAGAGREALLGRANTTQTGQLNQLRALLGQGSIAGGEQLQQGTFNANAARQTELGNAYKTLVDQSIAQGRTGSDYYLSDPNASWIQANTPKANSEYSFQNQLTGAVNRQAGSFTPEATAAAQQAQVQIQNKIKAEALAKLRAQYGL